MSGHRRILKGQPLSARALGFLLKLGDAQNQLQLRAVPVGRVIDPASPSQWDALHVLGRRLLIDTVDPQSVRLTRGGWAIYRRHR